MLKITDAAWERLSELQSTRPTVKAMRIAQIDGQLKCYRGVERKSDRVIHREGCPRVLLTPQAAENLADRTLDAPETTRGRRLRLQETRPSLTDNSC